jgi:hypothetical protein
VKLVDGHCHVSSCDEFVTDMDAAGIDQAVLLLPDSTYALKDFDIDIAEMIRQHAGILERHPGRFHYLCGVDPRGGREGVDIFEQAVTTQHCSGLKLYPPCGYSPSDRAVSLLRDLPAPRAARIAAHRPHPLRCSSSRTPTPRSSTMPRATSRPSLSYWLMAA